MDIFTCVFCISCLLLGCSPLTAAYFNEIGHMKTNHRVDIIYKSQEDFPDTIQIVLTSPQTRLLLNYSKTSSQFNIPTHVFNKNLDFYDVLDFGKVKDSLVYEDKVHETVLTFHCHNFETHSKQPCIFQSVFGIFYLDGHQHFIQHENFDKELWRQITKKNQKKTYILPHNIYKTVGFPNNDSSLKDYNALNANQLQNSVPRTKRASLSTQKTKYTIEVLALVDKSKWIENKTYDEGLKEMQIYIAHVFKGIDNLYRNIQDTDVSFSVKLMGIVLISNITDEIYLKDSKGEFYINGSNTLNILTKEREKHFSNFDHVVMFSQYGISADDSSTVGIANVGAMCRKESVSVVVGGGGFTEVLIAAHEIGHSLNSKHDGIDNNCLESDSYIMSARVVKKQSTSQKLNSFLFSPCSINTFKTFVKNSPNKCLEIPGKPFQNELPVVSRPTGQVYSPQEQCRTFTGFTGLCTSVFNQSLSQLCTNLQCLKDTNTCRVQQAAHKTSCGNKKWCVFGKCVYDIAAPEMDENCPFGDNENLRFTVMFPNNAKPITPSTCTDLLKLVPEFCDVNSQRAHCCKTCNPGTTKSAAANLMKTWCFVISITCVTLFYLF